MKSRLKGAQKGHSLLKKKADALQMRFRAILTKIIEVGNQSLFVIILAHFSLIDKNSYGRSYERSIILTC